MEIINNKVAVKLDKEERENLLETISFFERMSDAFQNVECCTCPFQFKCDIRSKDICFLHIMKDDLKYINNNCD